ncbi:MAG: hypothetical protein ACE5JB_00705 [bacterium]
MLDVLGETTSTSNLYDKHFIVSALSQPPFLLLDLDYTDKSIDSSKISDSASLESNFDSERESKLEILMSIFPGIREMTEKEAEEYQEFLEAYFD